MPYPIVEEQIKSLIEGECSFDEQTRHRYSTAACWYKILPIGVIFPRTTGDVQAVARYCSENEIALIPRGGATGLAGQAIGLGLILDFTRHMNRVLDVGEGTVSVEPGIMHSALNEFLESRKRHFPIDPTSSRTCTLGGMIATNAAGAHGAKYGSTKDYVEELTVVLASGTLATIKPKYTNEELSASPELTHLISGIRDVIFPHRALIRSRFPKVAKNSSGYNLLDALQSDEVDLRKIIVGSEGTLAIIVGAKLRLDTLPAHHLGAVAWFADYHSMANATVQTLDLSPAAVELMDKTYWSLAREDSKVPKNLIRDDAECMLYFDFEGDSPDALEGVFQKLVAVLSRCNVLEVLPLRTEEEHRRLWNLRESVSEQMNLVRSSKKASFIEDIAVPVIRLPEYMNGVREILTRSGIEYSTYGHAGSGNVHCAAFVDLSNLNQYRTIESIASEVNALAIQLGGTLSGEHGDGFVRTPFLEQLYGSEVYDLFRQVKQTFDPLNILNPGKIIGTQNATFLHDLDIS